MACYANNNFMIVTPAKPTSTTTNVIRYLNRAAEKLLTKSLFEEKNEHAISVSWDYTKQDGPSQVKQG